MADRYWVGGSGTWNNVSTTNWSGTSGGSNGASPPVAGDDVFFNSASNGTNYTVSMAASTTYAYRNITINAPLTGTVTFSGGSSATHNISGSVAVAASGVSSLGSNLWNSTNLTATTSGQTISLNGNSFSTVTFNGVGGAWTITTNGSTSSNCTLTAGTLNFDPVTWTTGSDFTSSNSNVRSLNLGSATINVGDDWTFSTTSNLTFLAGTSTINMTGTSSGSFSGGGLTYNTVNFAPSGTGVTQNINQTNTFANVSFAGPTSGGLNAYNFSANQIITGTLTATGATVIRRIFLRSSTVAATITLTAAAVSLAHVDFQSVTVAGAAVPATGTGLGNCGGNSGITFDAAKTVYWNLSGTQNWSATAWATTPSGSPNINNFPLAQDTAVFTDSGSAGTITIQTFNIGALDASGRGAAMTLNYGNSATFYGSHTWSSALSITGTSSQTFSGRGTMTFTSAGKTLGFAVTVECVTGTFQLVGTFTSTNAFVHTNGTFNTDNNTFTCTQFSSSNSATRTITLGTSTINLSGTGTVWSFSVTTGLTFSGASSTINLTDTTTTARTFNGGSGQTFGTLNIGGATGISTTTIGVSSGTIGTLSSTKTVAHTISFGSAFTITNWNVTGTSGNVVTVNSDTIGTQRTITYGGGQINLNFMSFRDINMSYTLGAANPYLVYAGTSSTNVGNNLGIAFIDGATQKAYRLTTGTTWTVPADWNSSNNNIYLIGAGGGGATATSSGNNRAAGGGGGGGGYTAITNFSASPSSSISYTVGTSSGNGNGGATTWNSGAFTAGGGFAGTATTTPSSSGGAGGTGTFAGGTGGAGAFGTTASAGYGAGGGGGAGGPNGIGGNGGNGFGSTTTANIAGGGGGGSSGGSGANATSAQGGNGGNNFAGTGGGAGSAVGSGTAGTVGGGGGGAANTGAGGAGGSGIDIQNTLGGGGGGGGNATGSGSVTSGLYGGGGAGGRISTAGGLSGGHSGGTGVIFIVYTLGAAPAQNSNFFLMF